MQGGKIAVFRSGHARVLRGAALVALTLALTACDQPRDIEAERADARVTMYELCQIIRSWHESTRRWPDGLRDLYPPRCQPPACMRGLPPSDPWGVAYRLVDGGRYPALLSSGQDRRRGSPDDLYRTCDGQASNEDLQAISR